MRIWLETRYRALAPFDPIVIPSFTVITGENGAGKTQFLQGIQSRNIRTDPLQESTPVYLHWTDLKPNGATGCGPEGLKDAERNFVRNLHRGRLSADDMRIAEEIAGDVGKNVKTLTASDIRGLFSSTRTRSAVNPFHHSLGPEFKRYHDKALRNRFRRFQHESLGLDVTFLSDREFRDRNGDPPWTFFNRVLAESDLPYEVSTPKDSGDWDDHFEARLIDPSRGISIGFGDLSSGEQLIMWLAVIVDNVRRKQIETPQVLLLDEPDASLDPETTLRLLNVIRRLFVDQLGMTVIVSTHSPTTVALSSEESVFVLMKDSPPRSVTKDDAIRSLTMGVPVLSVNYDGRRQVFVESKHDVEVFEKLFQRIMTVRPLPDGLIPDRSLSFIASGVEGSGSFAQVRKVVTQLRRSGSRSVGGIIDWDMKNHGSDGVCVLGEGERYSIENYLFDPLVLSNFLVRETIIERDAVGLSADEAAHHFPEIGHERLQGLADFVVEALRHDGVEELGPAYPCRYLGGFEVSAPEWYLKMNGHDLEQRIKDRFPPLKRFKNEGELKKSVVKKTLIDIPQLIPSGIVDVFRRLYEQL